MVFELHGVKYQTSHVDAPLLGCQVQIMGTDDMDDGNNTARAGREGGGNMPPIPFLVCVGF